MKKVSQSTQFARDLKRMKKMGKDFDKLKVLVRALAEGQTLAPRHRDHPLIGPWKNSRDCHVEPDWVLIYASDKNSLRLERTGSHSDLFN